MRFAFLSMLLLVGLSACATGPKASFVGNPEIEISDYETFAWIADDPQLSEPPEYSRKHDDRIEKAILSALTAKGYVFLADRSEADFVVGYSVGFRKNLKLSSAPEYFGANWVHAAGYLPPGGEKVPGRELGVPDSFWEGIHKDYGTTVANDRPEATLTVDIFDVESKTPAWQGSVEKEVTQHDRENADETINAAIAKLFSKFPSNRAIKGD